jgi:hypothetical protein
MYVLTYVDAHGSTEIQVSVEINGATFGHPVALQWSDVGSWLHRSLQQFNWSSLGAFNRGRFAATKRKLERRIKEETNGRKEKHCFGI